MQEQAFKMYLLLIIATLLLAVWSFIGAPDRLLWYLEAAPVLGGLAILLVSRRVYPLSGFAYGWIAFSFGLMLVGAHYTYAEVPLFDKELWGTSRNHYDRVGHFFQGVVPALLLREVFARNGMLAQNRWLMTVMIVGATIGISALYEIAEMTASFMVEGSTIDSFLGLQGDQLDTQKDMVMAMGGALFALLLCCFHDRSLKKLQQRAST